MIQVAQWTGFLAAQLYGAGAATIAHVPAWLPGTNIPRERVWQRRLLLLESIAPVPGSAAALVSPPIQAILLTMLNQHGAAGAVVTTVQ